MIIATKHHCCFWSQRCGFELLYSSVIATPLKYSTDNNYSLQVSQDMFNTTNLEDRINEDNIVVSNDMIVNEYWLFTRKNPTLPQVIVDGDVNSILNSNYDAKKPLKVVAHGWNKNGHALSNRMITSAYLETSDVNVIVIDWRVAASGDYVEAALRIPATGRALGNFLKWMLRNAGGNLNALHLIGYSFGAHIMSSAGRVLGGRPIRVTGLDPAGPGWSGNSYALNTAAGQYVEVIHTNIMIRGITEPIGHTDFYPNGGQSQPGCDDSACSHARSFHFFASSVRTDHFIARRCTGLLQATQNNCIGGEFNMGNGILDKNGRGIYALTTGSSWPF
ncbi:pancreatic lipase-related protein 2-like [Pararge aegeria]|uniref:pancreatic lipase-related protein 2-like n=1 Tax=Pararge aegeria TaxID=116150 RepID=UPI0019CF7D38|nr:pancreatic lipase-related protein 2-like [Pararge aegeria]